MNNKTNIEETKDKLEKIEFSIRMLHLHSYINDTQFFNLMSKLKKQADKELSEYE